MGIKKIIAVGVAGLGMIGMLASAAGFCGFLFPEMLGIVFVMTGLGSLALSAIAAVYADNY